MDFFAHPFGWSAPHTRKNAVELDIEGVKVKFMNPVHCLWNFILAAAVLNQREGDRVKRFRKDHKRAKLLIPIVKEYLIDLQNDVYPNSKALLKSAIKDLKNIRKHKATPKIEKEIGHKLEEVLADGITL